jgi:hypothetical protein
MMTFRICRTRLVVGCKRGDVDFNFNAVANGVTQRRHNHMTYEEADKHLK